jgi:hypothetical protein
MDSPQFSNNMDAFYATERQSHTELNESREIHWSEAPCERLYALLTTLAPKDPSRPPLHVVTPRRLVADLAIPQLDGKFLPWKPHAITYDIFDMRLTHGRNLLGQASLLQAVVRFDSALLSREVMVGQFGAELPDLFSEDTDAGQLFLCGIPALVLSQQELLNSVDKDKDALLKLFESMPQRSRPKWELFTSKVKLVEPGFRPSMENLKRGWK